MEVLENGVSQYPKLEGRFPQVAGLQYIFDPEAPSGSRVMKDLIKVGDEFIKDDAIYRLVTKAYIQHGKDGYHMLTECPILVSGVYFVFTVVSYLLYMASFTFTSFANSLQPTV